MKRLKAIILAAGSGTRMNSNIPKVIHKILDRPMIDYVIEAVKEAGATDVCVVLGHQRELVMKEISHEVVFALQEKQLGTGHAVMQAKDFIGNDGNVMVLFGDTPLITGDTLSKMVEYHESSDNDITVLSTLVKDATGYGRIIRGSINEFIKSVEHKDATNEEKNVNEINSGMYCFKAKELQEAINHLTNDNSQGEYYLPDTLNIIMSNYGKADAMVCDISEEILGINSRLQLAQASEIMQRRINKQHMLNGVTLINSSNTFISKDVKINKDTIIYPNTFIEGNSSIGENCTIGPSCKVINSVIGDNVIIEQSTILDSIVNNHTTVGPYAYIRPNSEIGEHVKIGDFVEIKNSKIGNNTKISHLTYIGDADVGEFVNFGCGTVVVNYDGEKKHRTTIKDRAFIGCNTNLISPVIVEEKAYTAAGSTITNNIPSYSLGIARTKQINIHDWVKKRRKG